MVKLNPQRIEKIKIIHLPFEKPILKKAVSLFLLAFYTFGTFFLPMGDFAVLKDLPEMFRHCKATEDRDLNVLEFMAEHVTPIGQLIEAAEHESEEDGDKPHEPIQSLNCGQFSAFMTTSFAFTITRFHPIEVKYTMQNDTFFPADYISKIFRPPIVA